MNELENRKGRAKINFFDRLIANTVLPFVPRTVRPNAVTVFRFICIPFVIYFFLTESYLWGTIIFVLAAFSDALDGAMARVRHQITSDGKFFDPLADKLLIGSASIILISRYISWQLALLIILLELMIISIALYKKRTMKHVVIQAKLSGKIKMVLQCAGIILLLFFILTKMPILLTISTITLWLAIGFAVISMFAYNSI
ncbi:MAG: CDP-alcohol phosphatidyltransferase family protein [bacterium]